MFRKLRERISSLVIARLMRATKSKNFYEKYWMLIKKSYSEKFVAPVCGLFEFESVLDAGCGNCQAVRAFLAHGKDASGIEISTRATRTYAADLMAEGRVINGSLTKLPYANDQFDLVFSSEVMEHLTEQEADLAVKEMVRVAKEFLFLTISLRPSQHHNAYHITLKPRAWWEALFCAQGCIVLQDVVDQCQKRAAGATTREILAAGPNKGKMHEMEWFIRDQVVDFKGEFEPWFFVFKKIN